MKRIVLLLVIVLLVAMALGRWMAIDSGYVLVVRNDLQIDATLGFVLLALIIGAMALMVVTFLFAALWDVAEPVRATRRWKTKVAGKQLRSGFYHLMDGDLEKSERLLAASTTHGDWPLAGWLLAAQAARERGDYGQSRLYLEHASEDRRGRMAAGLMRARYALDENDTLRAREELQVLSQLSPRNKRIVRTYADLLEKEQQWQSLVDIMPRLKSIFADGSEAARERRAWLALLQETATRAGFNNVDSRREEVRRLWKDVPPHLKQDMDMIVRYVGFLAQLGAGKGALNLIKSTLEKRWDDRLPRVLEAIDDIQPDDLISDLEAWLKERPGNGAILLTAGRVSLKARLWGKAQNFFEAAAHSEHKALALGELARLCHALGDSTKAERVLAQRVKLLDGDLPSLPLP